MPFPSNSLSRHLAGIAAGPQTPSHPSDGGEGRGEDVRCLRLPLSARGKDMGNKVGIDMGNTFSALDGPTGHSHARVKRLPTASQTLPFRPLWACDEVCSRPLGKIEIIAADRNCYPCHCLKCYPCVCPLPSSVLSPLLRRGERKKKSARQKSSQPATISTDTGRLEICATGWPRQDAKQIAAGVFPRRS